MGCLLGLRSKGLDCPGDEHQGEGDGPWQTYGSGPDTVMFSELDSIRPSPVQIAPWASQSVVVGS